MCLSALGSTIVFILVIAVGLMAYGRRRRASTPLDWPNPLQTAGRVVSAVGIYSFLVLILLGFCGVRYDPNLFLIGPALMLLGLGILVAGGLLWKGDRR